MHSESDPQVHIQTRGEAPSHSVGWARLWAIAHPRTRPMLRSGAWYPVVSEAAPSDVVLAVRHRNVRLPAQLLEVRRERPHRFTIVVRSRAEANPATGTRRDLGKRYAVCPASGHRIGLRGRPLRLECPGCGYRGEIAWNETG